MKAPATIFKIYSISLLIFEFFRAVLFFFHKNEVFNDGVSNGKDIWETFVMGARYDLMVLGYILLIPFLLLVIYDFTGKKILQKIAFWWIFITLGLGFMLTASNIVYYNNFYQPITVKTFDWFDDPLTVLGMIFQEPSYWFMFIPFILIMILFWKSLQKIFQTTRDIQLPAYQKTGIYFLFLMFMFAGIRGTLYGAPLRSEDAYIHHNDFLNQLKLNPVFVLEKSYEKYLKNRLHPLQLMDPEKAIRMVQKEFQIKQPVTQNPISRKINFDSLPRRKNVVLILMESMGAWKMKSFGNTENRTPFLDSLYAKSMHFSNLFSNGIHTYAGIYGTQYSYPEIFDEHPLKGIDIKQYHGLPQVLQKNGYETVFFLPHNKDFDNTGAFLSQNGYRRIYFEEDYPKEAIRNIWGVDDHFLLDFALQKIDSLHPEKQPFLATILTISDHSPYYTPEFIKGKNKDIRATRFADWALRNFFHKARQKDWFDNTIFVFVGDHGKTHQMIYKTPVTYTHIAACIYQKDIPPVEIDQIASQIDIFPVVMHLLRQDFINSTFGMDILEQNRKFAIINYDSFYAIANKEFWLIIDKEKSYGLYKYREKDLTDYSAQYPELIKEMETYFKSHIQTAQYILNHDLQKE